MNEQNHAQRIEDLEAKVQKLSMDLAKASVRTLSMWEVQLNILARSALICVERIQDINNSVIAFQRVISKSTMIPDESQQALLRIIALAESAAEKHEAEIAEAKAIFNRSSHPPGSPPVPT